MHWIFTFFEISEIVTTNILSSAASTSSDAYIVCRWLKSLKMFMIIKTDLLDQLSDGSQPWTQRPRT